MSVKFEDYDAWLLTALIFAQRDKNGPILRTIFYFGDGIMKDLFLHDELYSGFARLVAADIVEYKNDVFSCKDWFLDKFDMIKKTGGYPVYEEVKKILAKMEIQEDIIKPIDGSVLNGEIINKASKDYQTWFRKEHKKLK